MTKPLYRCTALKKKIIAASGTKCEFMTKKSKENKEVVVLSKSNRVNNEPMSIAMSYIPYTTTLEMNIYFCVLNKIALGEFKDRNLFDVTTQVVVPVSEIGETNFQRINAALNNITDAKFSLIDKKKEFCKYLVPIIGAEYSRYTGKIFVAIHPDLLVEFSNMIKQGYASYQLVQMLSLKKFFSKRLYELMSGLRRVNSGVWNIEFDILKKLLSAEEYRSNMFIRRALDDTAQEFIDRNIDIRFTYELVRGVKKSIERVVFKIKGAAPGGEVYESSTMTFAENKELTAKFEGLSSAERNNLIWALMHKMYTFKHTQVDEILKNPAKMALFYSTHNKIETGLIPRVEHRTRYMATVLGFKNRAKNA